MRVKATILSNIIWADDAASATRLSDWNAIGALGRRGSFHARYASDDAGAAFDVAYGGGDTDEEGDGVGGIEAVRAEAFAQGFNEGMAAAQASEEELTAQMQALTQALEKLRPAASGTLSSMLSSAVIRLVTQIVGNAPVDAELLHANCAAVAACVEDNDAMPTLRLHPEDMMLIEGSDLGVKLVADPALGRGSVRLDTPDGWIEDGPDMRLSRLRAILDDMEGRA